jgi:MFS family permease
MEGFLLGLAVGLGLGMVIGISIGAIMRREQKPMTPEEEKGRKKLVIAGIAITLLGVIAFALLGWLVEI